MRHLNIVHSEASLGWGGQEIRIFTEMLAMRSRGHEMSLAAQPTSQIFQKAQAAGFTVFPIREKALFFPHSILSLTAWLKKRRPDVVNTHSSKDGWIGGIAARLAHVPCIIRSKHIDVEYPRRFSSRIAYGVLPHHVLTTSEQIRKKISDQLKISLDHITNLPTGIDPQPFLNSTPASLREELGLTPETALVGMISVIRSWKGHRFFLEAAAILLRQRPDLHFIIAGDGPGAASLQESIQERGLNERFFWLGQRQDVPQLLKALNVLVLPSTAHEGVPQIILQAQMARCPVVASAVGGIPEVVQDGLTGRLVPVGQSQALADAISSALTDHELTQTMVQTAYARCLVENTIEVMCKRSEAIYAQLLGLQAL